MVLGLYIAEINTQIIKMMPSLKIPPEKRGVFALKVFSYVGKMAETWFDNKIKPSHAALFAINEVIERL